MQTERQETMLYIYDHLYPPHLCRRKVRVSSAPLPHRLVDCEPVGLCACLTPTPDQPSAMITPTFKLSQTPTHLTASIHCPDISVRFLLCPCFAPPSDCCRARAEPDPIFLLVSSPKRSNCTPRTPTSRSSSNPSSSGSSSPARSSSRTTKPRRRTKLSRACWRS